MGLSRSTFYNEPRSQPVEEARLVQRLKEIAAEWPVYGYRRVTAEVRAEGVIVNHKRVMRIERTRCAGVAAGAATGELLIEGLLSERMWV